MELVQTLTNLPGTTAVVDLLGWLLLLLIAVLLFAVVCQTGVARLGRRRW